jgi:S1-C subfamily serine protease
MKRWSVFVACLILGGLLGSAATTSLLKGQGQTPAVYPKELTSYRDVVKKVLPAVVSIEARQVSKPKQTRQRLPLDDQQVPEEFRRFFEQFQQMPQTPEGPTPLGFGSGFLVDAKGVILTNYHVVEAPTRSR